MDWEETKDSASARYEGAAGWWEGIDWYGAIVSAVSTPNCRSDARLSRIPVSLSYVLNDDHSYTEDYQGSTYDLAECFFTDSVGYSCPDSGC